MSVTAGLVARVTQPTHESAVNAPVPARALTYAPLPPPGVRLMAGAVSDTAPVVAITAAGPPPPVSDIELLATSVAEVPCTVAPLMLMVDGSILSAPALIRLALTTTVAGVESFRLLP